MYILLDRPKFKATSGLYNIRHSYKEDEKEKTQMWEEKGVARKAKRKLKKKNG
jgi:hypothetical protein